MKKIWIVVIVVVVGLLVAAGFAVKMATDFIAKKAGAAIVSTATGGHVNVNDNGVSINTPNGTANVSTSSSLPSGFPTNVPTPSFGKLTSSLSGDDSSGKSYTLVYTLTSAEFKTATATYKDQLKAVGFSIENSSSSTTDVGSYDVFSGKNGTAAVTVTVTEDSDKTATMVLTVTIQ